MLRFQIGATSTALDGFFGVIRRLFGGSDFVGDEGGMTGAKHTWYQDYSKNIMIDEPSILLGLTVWFPFLTDDVDFAHYFDMNLMNKPSMWGNPVAGLDEMDFLTTANLDTTQNKVTGTNAGVTANLLNLYLNGDTFCNDTAAFDFVGLGNEPIGITNRRVNTFIDVKLSVATDIVQ